MKIYIRIWLLLTVLLGFEYWALNYQQNLSILLMLQKLNWISPKIKFNTTPGRTISLWAGWIGFGLMVLMNVYSLRKRFEFMHKLGKLSNWLNFHIFCGLLGPTLIFFHSGLKVRGLVGISFWSMVVSLSSGIIGKYFFTQLSAQRSDFDKISTAALTSLNESFQRRKIEVDENLKTKVLNANLLFSGASLTTKTIDPLTAFLSSFAGDFRLRFFDMPIPKDWPLSAKSYISRYSLSKRKAQFLGPFEKLMGYWHAFHFPFAVFMYVAAVIHIVSSLIFLSSG